MVRLLYREWKTNILAGTMATSDVLNHILKITFKTTILLWLTILVLAAIRHTIMSLLLT